MKITQCKGVLKLVLLFVLAAFIGLPGRAASVSWSNNGSDFNTGTNWLGGSVPGTGDRAVYENTGNSASNLSTAATIQGITFNGTTSSGYTISGSPITLTASGSGASGAISANNTTGTNTLSANVILGQAAGSTANFTQAAGGTLVISGNISSTNAIAGITLAGGNGRIFTLSGNNTFSGNVSTGTGAGTTLNIGHANALSSGVLDLGGTLTIDNTSGSALTLTNNNNIKLGAALTFTGTKDLSFGSGVVTMTGNSRTITTTAGNLTIGSIDADTTARVFTKAGTSGTLIIQNAAGANFQGGFTLSAGTVVVGNKDALGSGLLTISGGATLASSTDLSGVNAVDNDVSMGASTVIGGTNNLTLSGNITLNGNSRTLTNSNTGATVLAGPIYLSNLSGTGYTLTLAGAQPLTVSGAIANYNGSGTAGGLTVSSSATVSLTSSSSSYTGVTSLSGVSTSVLEVSKLANGGSSSSIGASSNAAANLSINNNVTLRYVGSGDSTDRLFTINGTSAGHAAILDASGTGAVHFTNTGSLAYGTNNQTRTLKLIGSNTDNNSLAATIANNGSGATSLIKDGSGTWVLSGSNTYTGTTSVNAGTLLIQGAQTGTGTVTVSSGAAIGGSGSVGGSLSLLSGANIVFSLTDTLTVNGTSVTFGGLSIANIIGLDGSVALGTYTLIDGSATFNFNNVSNWGEGNATPIGGGKSAYFQAGSLQVVVIPEPGTGALLLLGLGAAAFARRRRA